MVPAVNQIASQAIEGNIRYKATRRNETGGTAQSPERFSAESPGCEVLEAASLLADHPAGCVLGSALSDHRVSGRPPGS